MASSHPHDASDPRASHKRSFLEITESQDIFSCWLQRADSDRQESIVENHGFIHSYLSNRASNGCEFMSASDAS